MTEDEWFACSDSTTLLRFLVGKVSERKLRLFCVACCERVEHLLTDARSRGALACARRHADGRADDAELDAQATESRRARQFAVRQAGAAIYGADAFDQMCRMLQTGIGVDDEVAASDAVAMGTTSVESASSRELETLCPRQAARAVELASGTEEGNQERSTQRCLVRDIFANPFRPATFSPSWRTDTAVSLAQRMYDMRDFGAMPILADALQDAGCDSDAILSHCRGEGPHVRGCWVVDLVLGKV